MSKREKLLAKLLDPRMTLAWPELVTLLEQLGYQVFEDAGYREPAAESDLKMPIPTHRSTCTGPTPAMN